MKKYVEAFPDLEKSCILLLLLLVETTFPLSFFFFK
jgi:hypothetical protein